MCKTFLCRFNSAKKDNDFIYHDSVPSLESLASVKGNRKEFPVVFSAAWRLTVLKLTWWMNTLVYTLRSVMA